MEKNMYIPPIHWDNETFLRMVEPYLTNDLERNLFARLSRAAAYDEPFEEGEYDTYPHEDLVSTLKERDDKVEELEAEAETLREEYARECAKSEELENEVDSLKDRIEELENDLAELREAKEQADKDRESLDNDLLCFGKEIELLCEHASDREDKIKELEDKIKELNETIEDKESDNNYLDRELTAVKNKLAKYE